MFPFDLSQRRRSAAKRAFTEAARKRLSDRLAGQRRIALPAPGKKPKVSVLLVLWNQAHLTSVCLDSLVAQDFGDFEVVVVDNASSDETPELMALVDHARIVRNEDNLGFVLAVNQGAKLVAGEYILLLNNDTELQPDAISRAVRRIETDDKIGAVGGQLIFPDGRLQDAGSIVWRDGRAYGYGGGKDPGDPEVMFVREVDYCSGAFFLIRRRVFEAVGGFDELFSPFYFEETDFCFQLAAAGWTVIYDPWVRLTHFEWGSMQAIPDREARLHANRAKFVEKHAATLAARPERYSPAAALRLRMTTEHAGRALVVDDGPLPAADLASLIGELVAAGWFVTYYPLAADTPDWGAVYAALPDRVEVMAGYGKGRLRRFLRARRGYYDRVMTRSAAFPAGPGDATLALPAGTLPPVAELVGER